MAIEISNAVGAPSVNSSYSTERVNVSQGVKTENLETQEKNVSGQNYSITSSDGRRTEENQNNGSSDTGKGKEPTQEEVKSKIDKANQELKHAKTGLDFKYHEATKRVSITVYDKETKEVIREIPPEKSLDMLEKMWELAGMVVDDKR
jgi:flagellar protein FlaG